MIFLPLTLLSGVTGAFFKALSLTMATSLVLSFVITWLAVPFAAEWLLPRETPSAKMRARQHAGSSGAMLGSPVELSATGLDRCGFAFPLIAAGYLAFSAMGTGFMPVMDEGGFVIDYCSEPGTALSETDRLLQQVEAILRATPEVATWSRRTGLSLGGDLNEANEGDFFVKLKSVGSATDLPGYERSA